MTISDKLNYLNDTKQAIKQAITDKGIEILETDTFRSYADKIASIEVGGGTKYKSSLIATATPSAYSPSIVSLSDYVLPDYTIKQGGGQAGLLYPKKNALYNVLIEKEDNFTVYGTPAINDNYEVSHFSANNYLKQNFDNTNTSLKCITRFKTGSSVSGYNIIFKLGTYIGYRDGVFWTWTTGNVWGPNVTTNTTYWAGFTLKGGIFNLYSMVDDGTYTFETLPDFSNSAWTHGIKDASGGTASAIDRYIHIGRENDSFPERYFTGTIYLKDTVLTNIDTGYELWAYKRNIYEYIDGICTKDFTPQAGTNTLNAYHIEYTDGTSECLLGQIEPTGSDVKSIRLIERGLTFNEERAWMYNEDSGQFE